MLIARTRIKVFNNNFQILIQIKSLIIHLITKNNFLQLIPKIFHCFRNRLILVYQHLKMEQQKIIFLKQIIFLNYSNNGVNSNNNKIKANNRILNL